PLTDVGLKPGVHFAFANRLALVGAWVEIQNGNPGQLQLRIGRERSAASAGRACELPRKARVG
ncbi:MAG: hypothetical protein M3Y27_30785, partial [Acidobacteriota bacterium]|nr:hypothetical protein [Acidobacteriota bacterium]